MSDEHLALAADFPEPSRDEWTAAVEQVLRGRAFEDVLVSRTRDDLEILPLYTAEESPEAEVVVAADLERLRGGWDVRQRHGDPDPSACNRAIIEDLERGVTSIELVSPGDGWSAEAMRAALAGVVLDLAPVALAPHADVAAARTLMSVINERGDGAVTGSWLGLDPLGAVARGAGAGELGSLLAEVVPAAAALLADLPNGRTVTVDGTRYGDAGATEAQELSWVVASGVACLRAFEDAGVDPTIAADTIAFRLSAGADQFTTIAMMRAARLLWARVLQASGVAPEHRRMALQAVTTRAMYSRRDPWVNMLRATTAALGAGVGGADAITVLPFDSAVGAPDGFGRRTARNTQLLLVEESHLARVVDPAGGAWFVESLTDRLAAEAWRRFQAVEEAGGMVTALADGSVVAEIDRAWDDRLRRLVTRRDPITGVSEFPLLDETVLDRREASGEPGLPVRRLAAPFEALRDAADRAAARGERPVVFLAALGDLADHTARSTWIANLLAVGGVVAVGGDTDGSRSPIEAEARFSASGATVAVICSSDAIYGERAAATATALREAGARRVVMAGAPGELRADFDAAGVDEYWHVGIDVVEVLERVHDDLGIRAGGSAHER